MSADTWKDLMQVRDEAAKAADKLIRKQARRIRQLEKELAEEQEVAHARHLTVMELHQRLKDMKSPTGGRN